MVTPMYDVDVATVYEIGLKLEEAIERTVDDCGWEKAPSKTPLDMSELALAAEAVKSGEKVSSTANKTISPAPRASFVSHNV